MAKQADISEFADSRTQSEGTETVRLKHLAEINPTKSEISHLDPETEVSFVALEDFGTDGEIKDAEIRTLDEVYDGYTYFREGDIAIAKITPSFENGKGAICRDLKNGIGFGTTELHILRPREGVSTEFIWFVLRSKSFRDEAETAMRGVAGQQRVPTEFLENHRVAKTAVKSGGEIAENISQRLEYIDSLISTNERVTNVLAARQQSLVSELLDDVEEHKNVKLKYLTDMLPGYAFSSDDFSDSKDNIKLLRGINVGIGETDWSETERWGGDIDKFQEYLLEPNDIVLAMDRPWINDGIRITQLNESDCPALLVQRVLRIRTSEEVLQKYVRIALESVRFKQYFDPILTGVSVPHISKEQVGNFSVPIPPLQKQHSIVSKWESFQKKRRRLTEKNENLIQQLREKRQALITAAVTD
ncbi:restriction endonuclease subunit S [Halorubrum ezzemoulense]|uniref:restriction endonuclease subunit S n=1 Tax=Halorubrum ezzemoulense TaxID=337243 RepID=UPI00232E5916|nr:restriction endonuclease subunit S [Halorubrum ezzemoulense]MDB2250073.1 restriction endonuclease subunit S [Halorubrum ezzemoulense]